MAKEQLPESAFLDHRLVEAVVNMPLWTKISKGEQKVLLKKNLLKYFPENLVYRKKWGFPAPVGKWLKGELKYLIEKYLSRKKITSQGIFDFKHIEKLVNEFNSGVEFHFKRIWALIIFQMWYYKYI